MRFAQDYDVTYTEFTTSNTEGSAISAVWLFVGLGLIVFMLAALWRVFTKAKQPGWAALVPIYNTYVELEIVGRPWWWLLLMLIPFVNVVVSIIVMNDLSKSFGKGVGFTLLLIFLPIIAYPMLAWGDAAYKGPSVAPVS